MEDDEHIGSRCVICNLRDYLPFPCADCKRRFCIEHWRSHGGCAGRQPVALRLLDAVFCPACSTDLLNKQDSDLNALMLQHLRSGKCSLPPPPSAPQSKRAGAPSAASAASAVSNPSYHCSMPRCKKVELFEVRCGTCRQTYCLAHRFETDHQCSTSSLPSPSKDPASESVCSVGRCHVQ